jgi:hypothetical protein
MRAIVAGGAAVKASPASLEAEEERMEEAARLAFATAPGTSQKSVANAVLTRR